MRPWLLPALGLLVCGELLAAPVEGSAEGPVETVRYLSPVYGVDALYPSMSGPSESELVRLVPWSESSELLWITGFRAQMVGADGDSPMPPEYMCHTNFGVIGEGDTDGERPAYTRFFTLSQGQLTLDFPPGFGIPVHSDELFRLETQVLNLNHTGPPLEVRHRVEVDFVRDSRADRPYTALYPTWAYVMVTLEDEPVVWGIESPSEPQAGASCLPGAAASPNSMHRDEHGRRFSGHFVVPPGRSERRTLVTSQMALPYDTTIHYVAVHLHPFAESLELRDLTSGSTVYRSEARAPEQGIGLEHVDHFADARGLPVHRDHDYELVARFDNPTGHDADAMAVMLLYAARRDAADGRVHRPSRGGSR